MGWTQTGACNAGGVAESALQDDTQSVCIIRTTAGHRELRPAIA